MTLHRQKIRTEKEIIASWGGDGEKPVVSICCITYNHESYIEDALRGFLIQETDFPYEILVHDDASTDNTAKIIQKYEKQYPNLVRPIYQVENQFSQDTRINQVFNFSRARGKFIALCDGDDFWTDNHKLQIQKNFLENNPDYVICYSDIVVLGESSESKKNYSGVKKDLTSQELQKAPSINTLTAFFRNHIHDAPREFCNSPCSDLLFWSQLGDFGKGKYLSVIKPAIYRIHGGGIHSMQTRQKQLQIRLEVMMGLYSYRLNRSDYKLAGYFLEEMVIIALKLKGWRLVKKIIIRAVHMTGRLLTRPFIVFFKRNNSTS